MADLCRRPGLFSGTSFQVELRETVLKAVRTSIHHSLRIVLTSPRQARP